jgi:predicted ribosomally synthesized peptide with nif11-like leader
VAALLERLQTDQGFRERLEAASTTEAKRQLVQDSGFDIGRGDLPALRAQAGLQELSDEDLERVAGGGMTANEAASAVGTGISLVSVAAAAAALA